MGQVGDQELKSQNKTLAESKINGVAVHFFEVLKKREYTYRGEVELRIRSNRIPIDNQIITGI